MLFSLVTVLGSWCFGDRRDSDIPTVKAFKKSHTFIYVYIATWCWQFLLAEPEAFLDTTFTTLRVMALFLRRRHHHRHITVVRLASTSSVVGVSEAVFVGSATAIREGLT